jgi:hypothetical protein
MKQKRSPKKPNVYFTKETEDAIVLYNSLEDDIQKNILYTQKIHPAFYKLAEIMIHRFKFYNFDVSHEDVKHEVITFLHEKMNKYKAENGKAFSYFSIVAKNYLIAENNKNYYHYKRSQDIGAIDLERNIVNEKIRYDMIEEKKDFIDIFVVVFEKILPWIFTKQRDIQVADTILYLFKTRENIENYNKKAIYILIRERTGVNSQNITNVMNKIKFLYTKLYECYRNNMNIEKMDWYEIESLIKNK